MSSSNSAIEFEDSNADADAQVVAQESITLTVTFTARVSYTKWMAFSVVSEEEQEVEVYDSPTPIVLMLFEYLYDTVRKRVCRGRPRKAWSRDLARYFFPDSNFSANPEAWKHVFVRAHHAKYVLPKPLQIWMSHLHLGNMHPDVLRRLAPHRDFDLVRERVESKDFEGLVHKVRGVDPVMLREYCDDALVIKQAHVLHELTAAMRDQRRVWIPQHTLVGILWDGLHREALERLVEEKVIRFRAKEIPISVAPDDQESSGLEVEEVVQVAMAWASETHDMFVMWAENQKGVMEYVHDFARPPVILSALRKRPTRVLAFDTSASVDSFVNAEVVASTMLDVDWRGEAWCRPVEDVLPAGCVSHGISARQVFTDIRDRPQFLGKTTLVVSADGSGGFGSTRMDARNWTTVRVTGKGGALHPELAHDQIIRLTDALASTTTYRASTVTGAILTLPRDLAHMYTERATSCRYEDMYAIGPGTYQMCVLIGNSCTHTRFARDAERIATQVQFVCVRGGSDAEAAVAAAEAAST